ncbi:hypothetical protein D3Z51_05155 [Clostridiaceae bacterium]|nr:hypothetical protein [Clostridiaceae bacterium]RKI15596.1 hypothetical protein D7V81_06145 [bacterium 1XD21-70]
MTRSSISALRMKLILSLQKKYIFNIFILTFLYVISAIGVLCPLIGLFIAIIEWIFLIFLFIQKYYFKAFCMTIAFITTSFETTTFISEDVSENMVVYSIYSIPIVRSVLCYAFIMLLCIVFYNKYIGHYKQTLKRTADIRRITRLFPVMVITGTATGLIVYIINDNRVAESMWYFIKFIEFTIKILTLMSLIYTAVFICIGNEDERKKLEIFCEQLIICSAIATTITLLIGFRGHYGSKGTLIFMPLGASIASALMLFAGYRKSYKLCYFILGAIFTAEILFVASSQMGSKFYIIPMASVIILTLKGMKDGRLGSFAGVSVILLVVLAGGGTAITTTYFGAYNDWKFTQLLQLFQFKGNSLATWYLQLPNSPRVRVDEFMSILYEYRNKPWYALFGKGNAGTITHHWGNTVWTLKGGGAFSDYEIDNGIFMFMHESLNVLFIRHGLLGLYFFCISVIALMKRLLKTPWAFIGLVWIVFYWGTYRSWWIGAIAFVLALTAEYSNKSIYLERSRRL